MAYPIDPKLHSKYIAILVAGGSGSRMATETPKQFLLLKQKPVLMHTIEAFYHSDLHPEIIVVLPSDNHLYWTNLCKQYQFTIPHKLTTGGAQRFDSVKHGLALVQEPAIVAIHDAVRPLVSNTVITQAFLQAEQDGTAIAALPSTDSVRQSIGGNRSKAIPREHIYLIQTPQAFQSNIVKKAYQQSYQSEFTDDASVVEHSGFSIQFIPGERNNIKITFPEDLLWAECYLSIKKRKTKK